LLAGQLALALVRAQLRRPAGTAFGDGHCATRSSTRCLTRSSSQRKAVTAITEVRQPVRMLRLLQGDVGSETVVAQLAAAAVSGRQAGSADGATEISRASTSRQYALAEQPSGGDPDRTREARSRGSGAAGTGEIVS
jgi:ATP-dependent DNA helicase RecG